MLHGWSRAQATTTITCTKTPLARTVSEAVENPLSKPRTSSTSFRVDAITSSTRKQRMKWIMRMLWMSSETKLITSNSWVLTFPSKISHYPKNEIFSGCSLLKLESKTTLSVKKSDSLSSKSTASSAAPKGMKANSLSRSNSNPSF